MTTYESMRLHSAEETEADTKGKIAVIGLAGRFPGARDLEQFWQNIRAGVDSVRVFSREEMLEAHVTPSLLDDPSYVPAHGAIDGIEQFDAEFFRVAPRTAEIMDPQQRLMLECAWECLEHAGYDPGTMAGRVGVFAGANSSNYVFNHLLRNADVVRSVGSLQLTLGNEKDFLSTTISYKLNLRGPSVTVATACSTSLVAVHLACRALIADECDVALAGGVSVQVPHKVGYFAQPGTTSRTGRCRSFDADADGTVRGSGAGIVALKRLDAALEAGDTIHAVIRGSAINNDGSLKVGFTAPSVEGQRRVIMDALADAGVTAETITYVEAHGSATPLGDPIEAVVLASVFGAVDGVGPCAIGSIKANIGHLDSAAGVAGLIKTILALKHREIPPSANFTRLNPEIDFAESRLFVNRACRVWDSPHTPRRAGVSSFGMGGTNAHVVLEEPPPLRGASAENASQLLVLSARSAHALETARTNLAMRLRREPDLKLADVANTLQVGRHPFSHRFALVCDTLLGAADGLQDSVRSTGSVCADAAPIRVAIIVGDEAEPIDAAAFLDDREPVLADAMREAADDIYRTTGFDCRAGSGNAEADPPEGSTGTLLQFVRGFIKQYARMRALTNAGLNASALIADGSGEFIVGATLGLFSLERATALAAVRAALSSAAIDIGVVKIRHPAPEVAKELRLSDGLMAIGAGESTIVMGPVAALKSATARQGFWGDRVCWLRHETLPRHHDARLHAELLEFATPTFVGATKPQIGFFAAHAWLTASDLASPQFWLRRLQAARSILPWVPRELDDGWRVVDIRPGRRFSWSKPEDGELRPEKRVLTSAEAGCTASDFWTALGELWLAGVTIDWMRCRTAERRARVPLPTYPFQRQRYWIVPSAAESPTVAPSSGVTLETTQDDASRKSAACQRQTSASDRTNVGEADAKVDAASVAAELGLQDSLASIWSELVGRPVARHENVFALGANSLIAVQVIVRLRRQFPVELTVRDIFEAPTPDALAEVIARQLVSVMDTMSEEDMRNVLAS